jgi:hypothetical protein
MESTLRPTRGMSKLDGLQNRGNNRANHAENVMAGETIEDLSYGNGTKPARLFLTRNETRGKEKNTNVLRKVTINDILHNSNYSSQTVRVSNQCLQMLPCPARRARGRSISYLLSDQRR